MTSQPEKNQEASLDLSAYEGLFIDECLRFLSTLRQSLDRLTDEPTDQRALREGHRAAHTLRGMASTMHYTDLVALGERLESQFRPESPLTSDQIGFLLARCDEFEHGLKQMDRGDDGPHAEGDER